MPVDKPASVANDPFRSAKWDELTAGRDFAPSDAPTLALLCAWYQVVDKCMSDIDVGDIKALPQLSTMKQASAEIRQLNKQLGIDDEARTQPPLSSSITALNCSEDSIKLKNYC